ncbi:MAG: TetR family transcriptional regulator [Aeromicrobium sp.]|nr:TetR family transcriptional regulator [Aeromicrobium sp.]
MYHQFADKTEVYAAVLEVIEDEVMARISSGIAEAAQDDIVEVMKVGARIWLDACAEPAVYRIVLIEAPSVLGWERWREVSMRHGMGMVQALLESAIESGRIRRQPVLPLAHVLIGALDEAAIYLARSDGSAQTRREVDDIIDRLVDAVLAG